MSDLRNRTIRLAHAQPTLRKPLLALLKTAGRVDKWHDAAKHLEQDLAKLGVKTKNVKLPTDKDWSHAQDYASRTQIEMELDIPGYGELDLTIYIRPGFISLEDHTRETAQAVTRPPLALGKIQVAHQDRRFGDIGLTPGEIDRFIVKIADAIQGLLP